jgi:hypothetical protein
MFLLALGRPRPLAARPRARRTSPLIRATGHVEAGHAMLAAGRFEAAASESNAALRQLESAPDGGALVAPSLKALQGEFLLRTGHRESGRAMLDEVVRNVRAASGPDAWVQALFTLDAIARAAREVGDWEFAGHVARQMFEHDPAYAGTHYALALVAEHAGDGRWRGRSSRSPKPGARGDPDLRGWRSPSTKTGVTHEALGSIIRQHDNQAAMIEGPRLAESVG